MQRCEVWMGGEPEGPQRCDAEAAVQRELRLNQYTRWFWFCPNHDPTQVRLNTAATRSAMGVEFRRQV